MELGSDAVRVLALAGFLSESDTKTPQAVAIAFSLFVSRALQDAVARSRVTADVVSAL
jgi:hypothetical protein